MKYRILSTVLLYAGCGGGGSAPSSAPTEVDVSATTALELPPTVRRNLGITFARVEARAVADTLRVPGAFELEPRARRAYHLTVAGTVELAVDQYERVEVGQLLYRFRSPAWPELMHEILAGEQGIASAQAELGVADATLVEAHARLDALRARLAALAELDLTRAELTAHASELEAGLQRLAAQRRLVETRLANARRTREHALHRAAVVVGLSEQELQRSVTVDGEQHPAYETIDWIEVRAAAAGQVERLDVTDGAFVEAAAIVLATVDPRAVRFRALALQADLERLIGDGRSPDTLAAALVPPREPGTPGAEPVAARVALGLEAHPQERTLTLLAEPARAAPWIRPGVSAFLELTLVGGAAPQLAIPTSALVRDGLRQVFFRRDPRDPDRVLPVEADLGVDDGVWVVVRSGVARGDEVVVEGAYELQLARATRGRAGGPGGGHVHADGTVHQDH